MAELRYVEGLRELKQALEELPKDVNRRVMDRAVGKACKLVADQAIANAPVYVGDERHPLPKNHPPPGTLKRSIFAAKLKRREGAARWGVFIASGYSVIRRRGRKVAKAVDRTKDAYYWRWVEYGHRIGNAATGYLERPAKVVDGRRYSARRGGKAVGVAKPRPYLRPAWDTRKDEALAMIQSELAAGVQRAAARLAKRRAG